MAPLIVLLAVTILARLAGQLGVTPLRRWQDATRVGLAAMLCFTAAAHFNSMRADLVRMVPAAVPNPDLMVTFTGLCEIFGAVGLLLPPTRRVAAGALIALLVAVLPANIHAAHAGLTLRGVPATPLVPRIALQIVFIALIWWCGVRETGGRAAATNQRGRLGAGIGSR
jgi:uncharacterized membrane protein